jgi:hypothetical protein
VCCWMKKRRKTKYDDQYKTVFIQSYRPSYVFEIKILVIDINLRLNS